MKPVSIDVHKKSATLELSYKNDLKHTLSAEYLRVFSPSAEVQGHTPEQAVLQFGKRNVAFKDLEPQGHYAIKITSLNNDLVKNESGHHLQRSYLMLGVYQKSTHSNSSIWNLCLLAYH